MVGYERPVRVAIGDMGVSVSGFLPEAFSRIGVSPITGNEVSLSAIVAGGRVRAWEKNRPREEAQARRAADDLEAERREADVDHELRKDIERLLFGCVQAGAGGVTAWAGVNE
jgi:hypothetical protein